jgi:hypothetical protein
LLNGHIATDSVGAVCARGSGGPGGPGSSGGSLDALCSVCSVKAVSACGTCRTDRSLRSYWLQIESGEWCRRVGSGGGVTLATPGP